eukprot:354286-Chlamydomonas_euryale.AAC.1
MESTQAWAPVAASCQQPPKLPAALQRSGSSPVQRKLPTWRVKVGTLTVRDSLWHGPALGHFGMDQRWFTLARTSVAGLRLFRRRIRLAAGDGWMDSWVAAGHGWMDSRIAAGDGWMDSRVAAGDGWMDSRIAAGDGWMDSRIAAGDGWLDSRLAAGHGWMDSRLAAGHGWLDSRLAAGHGWLIDGIVRQLPRAAAAAKQNAWCAGGDVR